MSSTVFLVENMKDKFKLIHRRKFVTIFLFYVLPVALAIWTYVDLRKVLNNGVQIVEDEKQDRHTAYVVMPEEWQRQVELNYERELRCINDLFIRARNEENKYLIANACEFRLEADNESTSYRIDRKRDGKKTTVRVYEKGKNNNGQFVSEFDISRINNEYAEFSEPKYIYRKKFIDFYEEKILKNETQNAENKQL